MSSDLKLKSVQILDEPVEELKARTAEAINRARWSGNWKGIKPRVRKAHDTVPGFYRERYLAAFDFLSGLRLPAFDYQKHDAAVASAKGFGMLTHTMGLGKTRIGILTALILNGPTLFFALPRLVRKVWVTEMTKLGIRDWVILERPKQSRPRLLPGKKGDPASLKGLTGIGKVGLAPVKRAPDATADPAHQAGFKILSYNMVLPRVVSHDYVVCPSCKTRHNREKCPKTSIRIPGTYTEEKKAFIEDLERRIALGEITPPEAVSMAEGRYGAQSAHAVTCGRHITRSYCPYCYAAWEKTRDPDLQNPHLGRPRENGEYEPGYQCHRCGYTARLWIPSMTRRLKKHMPEAVFLDESQAVKNRSSLVSRHTLSLRPRFRYLTSGTPSTTDVATDLYYQLVWLLGGKGSILLPYESLRSFQRDFGTSSTNNVEKLHRLLDPAQIRRESDDYGVSCEVQLPPVRERRISIPLSDEEAANYTNASTDIRDWLGQMQSTGQEVTDLDLFSKMWILRRATCVPWVDNPAVRRSTKLEALKIEVRNLLEQGRKVIVGTLMLDMLKAIREAVPSSAVLDGSTPQEEYDRTISLFQDECPRCPNMALVDDGGKMVCPLCERTYETPKVLAVSRNAVKAGVTLNKASVVIFTDPSWTYADMWQFWKRAHRVGASYRQLEVIYMETPDTVETKMYNVAEVRKESIIMAINRKEAPKTSSIHIRNFVSELLGVTLLGPYKREM
jgi:hypothetical protein